ncbi:MAG: hypothetical protein AB8G99_04330 [Planctomycetaceae bacterium]
MAGKKQTVWFIGEARDRELRFCLREMEASSRGRSIELFASIDDIVDSETRPDVVVVLQEWPKQYREGQINRLIGRIMPEGRLLCVYGTWCESDGRNNADLWPHSVRVAARNAAERFGRELKLAERGEPPLPMTASRDERFEHNHSEQPPESLRRTSAHVACTDRQLKTTLEARLESAGVTVHTDARTCHSVVWAPDIPEQTADEINTFASEHRNRSLVIISALADPSKGHSPMLANDQQLIATVNSR